MFSQEGIIISFVLGCLGDESTILWALNVTKVVCWSVSFHYEPQEALQSPNLYSPFSAGNDVELSIVYFCLPCVILPQKEVL